MSIKQKIISHISLFMFIYLCLLNTHISYSDGLLDIITEPISKINTKTTSVMPMQIIQDLIPKQTSTVAVRKPLPRIPSIQTERVMPTFNIWSYLNLDSKNVIMNHLKQKPDIGYLIGKKTREQFERDSEKPSGGISLSMPSIFSGKILFLDSLKAVPYLSSSPMVVKMEDINLYLNEILPTEAPKFEVSSTLEFVNIENPESLLNVLKDTAMIVIP